MIDILNPESVFVPSDATPALPIAAADHDTLRAALAIGSTQVLLMMYTQLSGDDSLLEKFAPYIFSPFVRPSVFPAELDQLLRERLFELLTAAAPPADPPLSTARLLRMMSTCVGEGGQAEFLPLLLEQMALRPAAQAQPQRAPVPGFKVLVIGAGLSGVCAGIKLGQAGYDYEIIEKSPVLGGVWWKNSYPGVGVDTPAHIYTFSFEYDHELTGFFSKGADILKYLNHCADKYAVRPHIRFNTEVTDCVYDAAKRRWRVTLRMQDGSTVQREADVVIHAAGLFTVPQIPDIEGLDTFKGAVQHTGAWDWSVDVAGRRVGMIGTGASALQVGPTIAPTVEHLTVFQRTPPWLILNPVYNMPIPEPMKWALQNLPHYARWFRFLVYWYASDNTYPMVRVDPNWSGDKTRSVSAASEHFRTLMEHGIQQELADRPDLVEKVTPHYPVFGKRVLQENGWYSMLKRDNVALVKDPIQRITERGIRTADGKLHEFDMLILATGFGVGKIMQHMNVVGCDGLTLREAWDDEEMRTYLGLTVPQFPNMFIMGGPNSGPTHGGGVNIFSEAQMDYIIGCLDLIRSSGKALEPKREVHDAYNAKVDAHLQGAIWALGIVSSYYLNSKGRNFISCPWRILDYWKMMRQPDPNDYLWR